MITEVGAARADEAGAVAAGVLSLVRELRGDPGHTIAGLRRAAAEAIRGDLTTGFGVLVAREPDVPQVMDETYVRSVAGEPDAQSVASGPDARSIAGEPDARSIAVEPDARQVVGEPEARRVVGVLGYSTQRALRLAGPYCLIQELWVVPRLRSHGVAAMLVEELARQCAKAGLSRIEVGLPSHRFPGLDRTVAFYERQGFAAIGPRMARDVR